MLHRCDFYKDFSCALLFAPDLAIADMQFVDMMALWLGAICTGGLGLHSSGADLAVFIVS